MTHIIMISLLVLGGILPAVAVSDTTTVSRVIDGDTFETTAGDKVRLIGVDCPESNDPNKPVEYFAAEAAAFLDSVINGRTVRLEYGPERTDKYGRLLCYVYVNDTLLVNQEIIARGYGTAYLRFPHKLEAQFLESELAARRAPIGMWASPRAARPAVKATAAPTTDETVYITKTGSKYHRATCGYLRKSAIPISKKDAIGRGYTACSKCNP